MRDQGCRMTAAVDYDQDDSRVCLVTGHQHRGPYSICSEHLAELIGYTRGIPRMTLDLGYHLVPGSAPAGEKITASRSGSPTSARLDALNLVGPGVSDVIRDPRSLAAQVRRWSTVTTYDVVFERGGKTITEQRELRTYHAETITGRRSGPAPACRCGEPHDDETRPSGQPDGEPVRVLPGDQVGAVPPAEFLDTWVRRIRVALQHPPRPAPAGMWIDYGEAEQGKRLARAALGEWARIGRGQPSMMHAVAAFLGVWQAYAQTVTVLRAEVGATVLGMRPDGPGHVTRVETALTGARPPVVAYDTMTAEWILRYGVARTAAAAEVDAAYLIRWLPVAAAINDESDSLGLADFAAELLALHRELECVLGLTRDEQWVGRCPAKLVDPRTGAESGRLCGAGIWHDPHRGTAGRPAPIECPRCHTRWNVREWHPLAARIQHAWPVDVRRRYTLPERKYAESSDVVDRLPKCRGCESTMAVRWLIDYRRGDKTVMYRPAGYYCPQRCLAGGIAEAAA